MGKSGKKGRGAPTKGGSTKGGEEGKDGAAQRKREDREKKKQHVKKSQRAKFGVAEEQQYERQIQALGCRIKEMTADGNCLFRSLADQREGRPEKHSEYRHEIMNYVEEQREDFEPFMEDDEKFDDYIDRLRNEKEWGGHQELFAASRLFKVNIVVHQLQAPRLEIQCEGSTRTLHLSYHGEAHYNSVRAADDFGDVPRPILPLTSTTTSGAGTEEEEDKIRMIQRSVPWASTEEISKALLAGKGDANAAIEFIVGAQDASEGDNHAPPPPPKEGADAEDDEDEERGEGGGDIGKKSQKDSERKGARKKPPQTGGHCPCGSGKKYRKCCRKVDRAREAAEGQAQPPSEDAAAGLEDKLRSIVI